MTRRAIELLLLVALGAALGWTQDSPGWTFAGALTGALAWSVMDGLRARSFLRWLNKADVTRQPRLSGTWGEMVDRARKLIKKLEKKAQNSDARLEDFLAAIQASPNLATGQIDHFGPTIGYGRHFDAQKALHLFVVVEACYRPVAQAHGVDLGHSGFDGGVQVWRELRHADEQCVLGAFARLQR